MAKRRKQKKNKITKFERLLYAFTIIMTISFPVLCLFSKSTLSKINYEVEKTKSKISAQSKRNEGLQMQVNELASLDKLEIVAKKQGLKYNNNSIKTIE